VYADGGDISPCPDGRILRFQNTESVFLFMDVFGTTVRVVENGRRQDRNTGRRKLKLIEGVIAAFRENCDSVATRLLLSGNALCGETFQRKQYGEFCDFWLQ